MTNYFRIDYFNLIHYSNTLFFVAHQPNAENNFELQFEAAWALTNIASTDRTHLILDCGAIPHMVITFIFDFLSSSMNHLFIILSIAALLHHFCIPHLFGNSLDNVQVNLMLSPNENVREQAAWCLGNVAGDGPKLRDFSLQCGM